MKFLDATFEILTPYIRDEIVCYFSPKKGVWRSNIFPLKKCNPFPYSWEYKKYVILKMIKLIYINIDNFYEKDKSYIIRNHLCLAFFCFLFFNNLTQNNKKCFIERNIL